MNYYPQYDGYPAQYQPMFWQAAFPVLIDLMILTAMGAWVFSLTRKALRGEEIGRPI